MKKYLYQTIRDTLREDILSGRLQAGQLMPSEHELCRVHSASRPTIRRALLELEQQALLTRRQGVGWLVAPSSPEGEPTGNGELLIGTDIFLNRAQFYTSKLYAGLKQEATRQGAHLVLVDHSDLETIQVDAFAGLILESYTQADEPFCRKFVEAGLPVIVFNAETDAPGISNLSANHAADTAKTVDYLFRQGHQEVAFVGSAGGGASTEVRLPGWRAAYEAWGREAPEHLVFRFRTDTAETTRLTEFFREHSPDAVFLAFGARLHATLMALAGAGLKVPDDVFLVCFDDVEELMETFGTTVSYIRMPLERMARHAIDHIVACRNGTGASRIHRTYDSELVISLDALPCPTQPRTTGAHSGEASDQP